MPTSFKLSAFHKEPEQAIPVETREWSPQQLAARDFVKNRRGNLRLDARAGTGKSTTLVNVILPELTGFVDVAVYNKKAELDLQFKVQTAQAQGLKYQCRGLQVGTFHRFGFGRVAVGPYAPYCGWPYYYCGAYGYPLELALPIAIDAVRGFGELDALARVVFVHPSQRITDLYRAALL
jgi:hypothetical protein